MQQALKSLPLAFALTIAATDASADIGDMAIGYVANDMLSGDKNKPAQTAIERHGFPKKLVDSRQWENEELAQYLAKNLANKNTTDKTLANMGTQSTGFRQECIDQANTASPSGSHEEHTLSTAFCMVNKRKQRSAAIHSGVAVAILPLTALCVYIENLLEKRRYRKRKNNDDRPTPD